jgi:ATP-dependent Lon protease
MAQEWEQKLKSFFGNAVVDKGVMQNFDTFKLPRFVSEYLVSQYIDNHGIEKGIVLMEEFLESHYPKANSTDLMHYKIQQEGEINIIDNFKVNVHIEKYGDDHTLTIPSLNIKNANVLKHEIITQNPRLLGSGLWGMGKITKNSESKRVSLAKFKPFQVASIDIKEFKELRKEFSTTEWIDALVSSIGFNPQSFSQNRQKLILLGRLLPLVQKSIFLYEFGRPGTGKTYIFDRLSNSSFVISGSKVTPAKLFKDCSSRQEGLLRQYEAILFDEVDKISDKDFADEIVNKLLKFMESNTFDRCGEEMTSNTSLIFSGNLSRNYRGAGVPNFFEPLANKLKGEAFLDRFSGVLPGWEIQPLSNKNNNFSSSMGFSADYFSTILSELRHEDKEAKIATLLEFSQETSNRDEKAILKTVSGYAKLIFPHGIYENETMQEIANMAAEFRQYILDERFELYHNKDDARVLHVESKI